MTKREFSDLHAKPGTRVIFRDKPAITIRSNSNYSQVLIRLSSGTELWKGRLEIELETPYPKSTDALTDESIITFGIHRGKQLADVPESYLIWLFENGKCYGGLKNYIEDNLEDMRKIVSRDNKK